MRCSTGVWSLDVLLLADEDAADDRRRAVVDLHLRVRALRVDRRNAVDLAAEVRRSRSRSSIFMMTVLAAVICGVTAQHQHGVLERDGDGVVGDGLNRNLDALRDLRLDVVLRRQARRREDAALAGALERRQRDVEVERAVDRAEREADAPRSRRARRRFTAVPVVSSSVAARIVVGACVAGAAAERAAVRERQAGGVAQLRRSPGR